MDIVTIYELVVRIVVLSTPIIAFLSWNYAIITLIRWVENEKYKRATRLGSDKSVYNLASALWFHIRRYPDASPIELEAFLIDNAYLLNELRISRIQLPKLKKNESSNKDEYSSQH